LTRANRSTPRTKFLDYDLTPEEADAAMQTRGLKSREGIGWGLPASKMYFPDPQRRLPAHLAEFGRLVKFHVLLPEQEAPVEIKIDRPYVNRSHVGIDVSLPRNRTPLYIATPPEVRQQAVRMLFNPRAACTFHEAAQTAGGRHADDCLQPWWPVGSRRMIVTPIGVCATVTYHTHKRGDDPKSNYIHQLGEETGIRPLLCVDGEGFFWLAGGNYTNPNAGITD